jgi:isopentenyl phosphate kinase
MNISNTVFVKLGGAAITDKTIPRTPLKENITNLANQIACAHKENPGNRILIGHGSGSFGHYSGKKHNTRAGVSSQEDWLGFAEVWQDARMLNEIVIHAFLDAGLPVIAFPPSAWLTTRSRGKPEYHIEPIVASLGHGLIPVVNGDVIFDSILGGTIFSTEEIFAILAANLNPARIILASREPGVWEDFPENTRLAEYITPKLWTMSSESYRAASGMDVTGGMAKKIAIMMRILENNPSTKISIVSGMDSHSLYDALIDKPTGTLLHSD